MGFQSQAGSLQGLCPLIGNRTEQDSWALAAAWTGSADVGLAGLQVTLSPSLPQLQSPTSCPLQSRGATALHTHPPPTPDPGLRDSSSHGPLSRLLMPRSDARIEQFGASISKTCPDFQDKVQTRWSWDQSRPCFPWSIAASAAWSQHGVSKVWPPCGCQDLL